MAWIRWFPSDWRGSTAVAGMSLAERGVYVELLMLQAAEGPFELDFAWLARQLRATEDEVRSAWKRIARCFIRQADGRWANQKMAEEVARGRSYSSEAQAEKGRKRAIGAGRDGGRFTSRDQPENQPNTSRVHQPEHQPHAQPSQTPTQTQNSDSELELEEKGATRPARERAPSLAEQIEDRPVGVAAEIWRPWLEYLWSRPGKKPPPTTIALHRTKLTALVEKHGAEACKELLEGCIANIAQGLTTWAYAAAMAGNTSHARQRQRNFAAEREAEAKGVLDQFYGPKETA